MSTRTRGGSAVSERTSLGILLAGGASRRFGEPKAGVGYEGRPLAEIALGKLADVLPRVGIVAATPGTVPGWRPPDGVEVRGDDPPGVGPLGGICAALSWARELGAPGVLALPVDTPLVPPDLLARILELAEAEGPFTGAVVPRSLGPQGCEPLCAWYGADLLNSVRLGIRQGIRAPVRLLGRCSVRWVSLAEVSRFGDPEVVFHNLNRPADLPGPVGR
jgi:molybdopterin-guanine dinucleotide biosynthesis protein A